MRLYFYKIVENLRKFKNKSKFIKIDISFFLLFVLAYFLEEIKLYMVYVLFVSMHELCHYFVAKKLGYLPQKIHFTFFGASLEGYDDFLFSDEIKIVLAGPLFNFCVIVFCYLSFWFNPESYIYLNDILSANLSIFLFNLLPIFPLDMGRFLLAWLSKKYIRTSALQKVKSISLIVICVFFTIFLISFFFEYNFTLGFVCVNLVRLLFSSSKDTSYKRQIFVYKKLNNLSKGLSSRTIYINDGCQMYSLFKFIDDSHFFNFIFLNDKGEVVKSLSEIELYKLSDFI